MTAAGKAGLSGRSAHAVTHDALEELRRYRASGAVWSAGGANVDAVLDNVDQLLSQASGQLLGASLFLVDGLDPIRQRTRDQRNNGVDVPGGE